jgi:hypothetical protein
MRAWRRPVRRDRRFDADPVVGPGWSKWAKRDQHLRGGVVVRLVHQLQRLHRRLATATISQFGFAAAIPEPGTYALIIAGAMGLAARLSGRRREREPQGA